MADRFCSFARCMSAATHFVTYFSNGDEGRYCCAAHLADAVDAVLGDSRTSKRANATVNRIRRKETCGRVLPLFPS